MILLGIGISTNIPTDYQEIIRRLRLLGLTPSGNPIIDKSKLENAIDKRIEEFELEKKVEEKKEEKLIKERLETEKQGATQQGMLNRILHNI